MAHVKRRKKSTRFRGSKTHARGFKKKARGSGHQGGVGMAGSGKRGDQKKTLILNLFGNDYFGKDKTLRRGTVAPKLMSINLGSISEDIHSFVKQGIAKDNKGLYDIDLKGYKVLGEGELTIKAHIKASAASKSALDKIKASGSTIELASSSKVQQKG